MGCNCGGGKRTTSGKPADPVAYQLTRPDGTESTYISQLEAKRERRKAGGGTIRTVAQQQQK